MTKDSRYLSEYSVSELLDIATPMYRRIELYTIVLKKNKPHSYKKLQNAIIEFYENMSDLELAYMGIDRKRIRKPKWYRRLFVWIRSVIHGRSTN